MTKKDVSAIWAKKAESDGKAAIALLLMDDDAFNDAACFHFQQCAEKYIKALMCHLNIPFKKTHDLGELAALLPPNKRPPVSSDDLENLSDYAVNSRYPGMSDDLTREDASAAHRISNKIKDFVLGQFQK